MTARRAEVCDTCKLPTGFTTTSTRRITCDACYAEAADDAASYDAYVSSTPDYYS